MDFVFYIKLYLLTIPVFFLIDIAWLNYMVPRFYKKHLSHLMSKTPYWRAAIIFYFIFIIGILIFGVIPFLENENVEQALIYGGLYGFFTYATYDLTNLATLHKWSAKVSFIDIIWGSFLCSSVASISFFIGKWLM